MMCVHVKALSTGVRGGKGKYTQGFIMHINKLKTDTHTVI